MEKVKITPEQDSAIKRWINKEQLIIAKASGLLEHSIDESIAELTMEQLVKALYIGYEVEPEFSIGDWVVYKHNNTIWKIIGELHGGKVHYYMKRDGKYKESVHKDHIRLATPEEIKQEKERRWWKKHGRNLWELRKGDLLIDKHFGKIAEVRKVKDNHYLIGKFTSYEPSDFVRRNYTVVCFSEQRLDREGE